MKISYPRNWLHSSAMMSTATTIPFLSSHGKQCRDAIITQKTNELVTLCLKQSLEQAFTSKSFFIYFQKTDIFLLLLKRTKLSKMKVHLKGNHGYDYRLKQMHALFVAIGPAIRVNNTVATFQNIELYNLFSGHF